jgi:CubicO group peptidase (beta-lactamase class C family)
MFMSKDWLGYCLSVPLVRPPGQKFSYSSSSMIPLGAALAKAVGSNVPDLAQRVLYDPLGIEAHNWLRGPNDVVDVEGSHWLRPRDMAKLGYLFLRKGKWGNRRVVSEKWVNESTSAKIKGAMAPWDYGYLWWRDKMTALGREMEVTIASGNGGQYIIIVPDLDLVCVTTAGNYNEANDAYALFREKIVGAFSE